LTQLELQKETEADPYILFEYSIRSPYTKESYFRRLRRFFDSISLQGPTFESRCNLFGRGKQDPNWAFNSILKFTLAQKKRVEGKAETESAEFPRARYLQYNRSQKRRDWKYKYWQ
jgi:hypothetical protein